MCKTNSETERGIKIIIKGKNVSSVNIGGATYIETMLALGNVMVKYGQDVGYTKETLLKFVGNLYDGLVMEGDFIDEEEGDNPHAQSPM